MNSSTTLAALIAHCRRLTRRQPTPDAELLCRFAGQREAAAFEELVERYAPLVWGVCRRILPRETDCEDAFQAAFLSLVRQADSIDPNRPLGAWLHTIAVRTAAKAQARIRRQPTQTAIPEQTTRGDIADELGNRELFRIVDEEIARLPALLREPFVLCCLEGRTRDEAAAALGCSVAAIKSRLERSRNLLRRRLERRGFGLPAAFFVLGLTGSHVSASLRAKALHCVFGSVPSAVAALVPAVGASLASKLTLTVISLVMVGVLGFGAFYSMEAEPANRQRELPGEAPAQPNPAADAAGSPIRDRFGDPLPPGAIRRFGTLRFRHSNVHDLTFTSGGKQLIAGTRDGPLVVFDAASGRKLRRLGDKDSQYVRAFAFSPDGKRVACCCLKKTVVLDLQTGQPIRQLNWPQCEDAAFSPDGTKVAVIKKLDGRRGKFETRVVVLEATAESSPLKILAEKTLKEGKPQTFGFGRIAFSPDGKFLAVRFSELYQENPVVIGVSSSQVWLLDAATGDRVRTFGLAGVPIACFAFQPGMGRLATYGKDGIIRFWDTATGKEVRHFQAAKGNDEDVFSVLRFSADGRCCAVLTDRAKFLTVLDAKDGRVIRRIEGRESQMFVALALSADGKTVASARPYDESRVRVWDVASGIEHLAGAGHRAAAIILSLSADAQKLISRDVEGETIYWDLQTGKSEVHPATGREENGRLVWSRDFDQATLRDPRLRDPRWRVVYKNQRPAKMEIWSPDGSKLIRKMEMPQVGMPMVAFSPDGRHLAIAGRVNSTVMLWDPEREETPRQLPGRPNYCRELLFSHDGKRLIGTGRLNRGNNDMRGVLWIWDTEKTRLIRNLTADGIPSHLLLTAEDRVLLAGIAGKDTAIRAWNIETGEELARITDPSQPPASQESDPRIGPAIAGLAQSADSRFLAVVSLWRDVSALSIWETGSWKLIRAFAPTAPRNDVKAMVFSRDGRSLFTANGDTTILEWDISGRFGRKTETPNQDRLNALWQTLREAPDKAYPAMWEMLDHPAESVPFLIGRISPAKPVEEKRVRQLLAQLDSESFAQREEASRQLLALGERIVPMLRKMLTERLSLEVRKRVEGVIESQNRAPTPDQLRLLRVVAVLEWSNRPEAIEHVRRLAAGAPSASLTQAARMAHQRLQKKSLGGSRSPGHNK